VFHLQGDLVDSDRLVKCVDFLMTTSPNVMVYAALDAWRRQMVERGNELLSAALKLSRGVRQRIGQIPDVSVLEDELLGEQASHDLDRLQILIDVADTGTSGYQAADWMREHCLLDIGEADHRRMVAKLTYADDAHTVERLVDALTSWREAARDFGPPPQIDLPSPDEIQLETAMLPRDAFFGPTEMVPAGQAAGRISAELITPYPPGIPAVTPGEVLNDAVINYLRTGAEAGMNLPDAADSKVHKFLVAA
jgi:lysine decarboxylase